MLEQARVASDIQPAGNRAQFQSLRRRLIGELVLQAQQQIPDREGHRFGADRPFLDLIDVEQGVQHAGHGVQGIAQLADLLGRDLALGAFGQEPLEQGEGLQRLAKIVAGGGQEARFGGVGQFRLLLGGFQRMEHAVAFGHIDEGDDDPFDAFILRAVGHDTADIAGAAAAFDLAFDRADVSQHRCGVDEKPAVGGQGMKVRQGPPDIAGNDIEQRLRHRGEKTNFQLRIEENRRDIGAVQHILQIVRRRALLFEGLLQLAVERGQFLVERLQFFLRGQQFLVGRLIFLIDRQGLLGRGLVLFIRDLEIAQRGLQLQARRGQCPLQVALRIGGGGRAGGGRGSGLVEEADQHQLLIFAGDRQQVDAKRNRGAMVDPQPAIDGHFAVFPPSQGNRRAQYGAHFGTHHRQQFLARMTRRNAQIAVGRPAGIKAFQIAVDQDGRRRVGLHHQPPAQSGEQTLARGGKRLAQAQRRFQGIGSIEGKADFPRPAPPDMAVNPFGPRDHLEAAVGAANRLGASEQKDPAIAQGEMEQGNHPGLGLGQQIDQQIPAGNEVEAREGRVGEHILYGEHHRGAQVGVDAVAMLFSQKEARQARRRNIGFDGVRVEAIPGDGDRPGIDVGGEQLKPCRQLLGGDLLGEKHRQGIGFLPRAAAGHPDAQLLVASMGAHQIWNDLRGEIVEHFRVAEKAGDVDQQVLGELAHFRFIVAQDLEVALHPVGLDRGHRHAAFDAPPQGPRFIQPEVMGRFRPQKVDDFGKVMRGLGLA